MTKAFSIFKKSSLGRKMAAMLVQISIASLPILFTLLNLLLQNQAVGRIDQQSNLVMDSMLASRHYTSENVNPIIAPINKSNLEFLPDAVPSYSATTVFSFLKKNPNYTNYSHREATLNPTNLKDKADSFEAALIEEFRANPTTQIKSGSRQTPSGNFHYLAKPIKVSKQSCLACHSDPGLVPKASFSPTGRITVLAGNLGKQLELKSLPCQ